MFPVLGAWEGAPIFGTDSALDVMGRCPEDDGWYPQITFAIGYRYTGVHSIYVTAKAGVSEVVTCASLFQGF